MQILATIGLLIPHVFQFRSVIRGYPAKPAKPKAFDDFACDVGLSRRWSKQPCSDTVLPASLSLR
jgi:hypothetical protein